MIGIATHGREEPTAPRGRTAPSDLRAVGDQIEGLVNHLESSLEGRAWEQVQDVISLVTQLYGGGLARILELVDEASDASLAALRERLFADDLVASLLVLHDLHPLSWEDQAAPEITSVPVSLGRKPTPVAQVER